MNREDFIQRILEDRLILDPENSKGIVRMPEGEYKYLFAKNDLNQGLFLMWEENELESVTMENYTVIWEEANRARLSQTYHVFGRFALMHHRYHKFHQLHPHTGEDVMYMDWLRKRKELHKEI